MVFVFVYSEILFDELLRLLFEVFGDSFDVGGSEKGSGCFAAVGTGEAVCFFEFGCVEFLHYVIEILGLFFFELVEIFFVLDMFIFGELD